MNTIDIPSSVQAGAAVVIGLLTFALVLVNIRYVRLTRRIAAASVEQSEALQKPCITIRVGPLDYIDAHLNSPNVAAVTSREVEILNIGSGPAIRLEYEFRHVDVSEGRNVVGPIRGFLNHLKGETIGIPIFSVRLSKTETSSSAHNSKVSAGQDTKAAFDSKKVWFCRTASTREKNNRM